MKQLADTQRIHAGTRGEPRHARDVDIHGGDPEAGMGMRYDKGPSFTTSSSTHCSTLATSRHFPNPQ